MTCALAGSPILSCVGYNAYGGLGDSTQINNSAFQSISLSNRDNINYTITDFAAGRNGNGWGCIVLNGGLRCWGEHAVGNSYRLGVRERTGSNLYQHYKSFNFIFPM